MSKKASDQSGQSSTPDQKKLVQNEARPAAVKSQKVGGRYKAAELYDFDRYFPRPGTAEYGC